MRRVPNTKTPYLIIGDGRLARHLSHYFTLLDIPFTTWCRRDDRTLTPFLNQTDRALLAITDDAIEGFIPANSDLPHPTFIHFSGSVATPLAESAHPLFTFGPELYDLETYQSIPFVTEKGRSSFQNLFPELSNPSFSIDAGQKPNYHAWAAMAGNFTTILWTEYFRQINKLGLPKELVFPYLKQVVNNSLNQSNALTGPLARGDQKTIQKHLDALSEDDFQEVYEAFVNVYRRRRA